MDHSRVWPRNFNQIETNKNRIDRKQSISDVTVSHTHNTNTRCVLYFTENRLRYFSQFQKQTLALAYRASGSQIYCHHVDGTRNNSNKNTILFSRFSCQLRFFFISLYFPNVFPMSSSCVVVWSSSSVVVMVICVHTAFPFVVLYKRHVNMCIMDGSFVTDKWILFCSMQFWRNERIHHRVRNNIHIHKHNKICMEWLSATQTHISQIVENLCFV